jgi:hypothetical protein
MNDALRGFKKATDQVRIRFDARQLVSEDVQHLLDQAQPLDDFMRNNPLTEGARNDWSTRLTTKEARKALTKPRKRSNVQAFATAVAHRRDNYHEADAL